MLQVNRISKSFGPHKVLREVTFSLNDGDHVGLVGANGSGKSTLMKILAGAEKRTTVLSWFQAVSGSAIYPPRTLKQAMRTPSVNC